jgi:CBS domain containing-hemolysin-like protein
MVPRTEMIAVSSEANLEEINQLYLQHSFTKLPVFGRNLDQILGIVHLNDLLRALHEDQKNQKSAQDLMREAIFIPENARISGLLRHFRDRQQHIAIVLDEYGGTAGMVTLEDLLEEIIGEVGDPFDPYPEVQSFPDGSNLVDGLMPIEDFNERFDILLENPDYNTVAGFVLGRLGRLAQVGDSVDAEGLRFQVEAMDGLRIARLSIRMIQDDSSQSKPTPTPGD